MAKEDDNIVALVDLADSIVNPNNAPWTFDMAIEVVKLLAKAATEAYEASFDILLRTICQKGFTVEAIFVDDVDAKVDVVKVAGKLAEELEKDIEARR
jgi:hypothetical protein